MRKFADMFQTANITLLCGFAIVAQRHVSLVRSRCSEQAAPRLRLLFRVVQLAQFSFCLMDTANASRVNKQANKKDVRFQNKFTKYLSGMISH
jgi:hypothetical protein